jgi:DNA mismatch repair protein MutS
MADRTEARADRPALGRRAPSRRDGRPASTPTGPDPVGPLSDTLASSGSFRSILFAEIDPGLDLGAVEEPGYFADLHLDDIVASATAGRDAYDLKPFFHIRLGDVAAIGYRHDVFRDLEDDAVIRLVRTFAKDMRKARERLEQASTAHYRYEQERWLLDAAAAYCRSIDQFEHELAAAPVRSRGLDAFREFLAGYVASDGFTRLSADVERVWSQLGAVRYRLRINGGEVVVGRYVDEPDYGAEVLKTFEKFRQGAGKDYEFELRAWPDMNHVEDAIVERVALLFPEAFESLERFCGTHQDFIDPTVARFDREIQFYVAYVEHIGRLKSAGLAFCYPEVTPRSKEIKGREVYDLALANLLVDERKPVVTNDFELSRPERVIVVSGPNQGGKTTFARTIGQLQHLAAIGVPVPGSEARLHLVDRIFAHFERVEEVEDLSSKLEDDLRRIKAILSEATAHSLLVMNESFSSTTLDDQLVINKAVLRAVIECGLLCVAVTFLDELASLDVATVSMVSTVDPDEPARRTFKIVRRPADGLAYAMAIAEKHRVTYRRIKERLER